MNIKLIFQKVSGVESFYEMSSLRLSVFVLLFLTFLGNAFSQSFPANFSQVQYTGLKDPSAFAPLPDGRLLITEKNGTLKIFKNGQILSTPALTISVDNNSENGLLGVTADPDFATNQIIYLFYTAAESPAYNRVSRFVMSSDAVLAGSEKILFRMDDLTNSIHNAGAMQFGKDGKLYLTVGDNANGVTYNSAGSVINPMDLTNYFGKMLRVNKDGSAPADNPYYSNLSPIAKRIWSTGLRNPYSFAIQPGSGKIFINDVGQESWEEINDATKGGENFGWPVIEGVSNNSQYANPLYVYQTTGYRNNNNEDAVGCAITGGDFFNPTSTNYPTTFFGKYFFMDHCNSWINYIDFDISPAERSSFATGLEDGIIYLTTGIDGNLYYLGRTTNSLYKIIYSGSMPPAITKEPENVAVSAQKSATLTVFASGAAPLSYQWKKDGSNIDGATSYKYAITSAQVTEAGDYSCTITNSLGSVTSRSATLTVTDFNSNPSGYISSPTAGTIYRYGDVIYFNGGASDTEDGPLADASLSWLVRFYHNNSHYHPVKTFTGVSSGSFVADYPETDADVYYTLMQVATDAQGLTDTTIVNMQPKVSQAKVYTKPSSLNFELDGNTASSFNRSLVSGSPHSLKALTPQIWNGNVYQFDRWHQGDSSAKSFNAGDNDYIDTAIYTFANLASGISYNYYEGSWDKLPDFSSLTPSKSGSMSTFNLSTRNRDDNFGFKYNGIIEIPSDGTYTFYTTSDDGSKLYIDGALIVDNDGLHGERETSGTISLTSGKHFIKVEIFEANGGEVLSVSYSSPSISKQLIPSTVLWHVTNDPVVSCNTSGNILHETWTNIYGTSINDITESSTPNESDYLDSFEAPTDIAENYGTRIRGYICPPLTGNYIFYIAGDDNVVLRLSTNDSPATRGRLLITTIGPVPESGIDTTRSNQILFL